MSFQQELEQLINKYSQENGSNTPDFILARYLNGCLGAFNEAVESRELWYGRKPVEGVQHLGDPDEIPNVEGTAVSRKL